MEEHDRIKSSRQQAYPGALSPAFYNAKDEYTRRQHIAEASGFPADPGNYGVGGYYGNTYKRQVYDLQSNREQYGAPEGHRDTYRHLGDRRWINDPDAEWEHEQSPRYGYRSMNERMEQARHRGKGPRSYQRSDQRILEDLNDRLCDDPWLNASDIETSVQDGVVILSGSVEDRAAKRRAEDIVENVRGVKDVENRIRLSTGND